MKGLFNTAVGILGSLVTALFGGWDTALSTLIMFMAMDYVTGIICAGVFHKSNKTENGALESNAGFKGLCRKCAVLFMVLISHRLDLQIGTSYIKNAVIIGFIANETISILENVGIMGVPIPKVIKKAIDILHKNVEKED